MNSYERVKAALSFQEPDRVPVAEFLIDKKVYTALMPEAKSQYDFDVAFDLDVLAARAYYKIASECGSTYTDEWGITYTRNKEMVAHPVAPLFTEISDLYKLTIPDPDADYRLANLSQIVSDFKGERAIAYGMRAMFLWAANLVGLDNMLVYMLTEKEFVSELLDRILEGQIKLAKNAIRAGADIIIETDDYAFNSGPLCSPAIFDELITPRLKKFTDEVHKEGGFLLKHTDGNIMKIMHSFIAAGVDGLQSLDPIAGMDMGVMKEMYGDKISLWGNIDCGNLLTYGTPSDVRAAVKECILKGAKGGGLVLMSSNSIPHSAKPENYKALLDAAREFGTYPIK